MKEMHWQKKKKKKKKKKKRCKFEKVWEIRYQISPYIESDTVSLAGKYGNEEISRKRNWIFEPLQKPMQILKMIIIFLTSLKSLYYRRLALFSSFLFFGDFFFFFLLFWFVLFFVVCCCIFFFFLLLLSFFCLVWFLLLLTTHVHFLV